MVEKTKQEKVLELFEALETFEDTAAELADAFKGTKFEGTAENIRSWLVSKVQQITYWAAAKAS
jgi:hypothetical protein